MKRHEDSHRDLWESIKCSSICIIAGPRRRREKAPEKIFEEIIDENFPNLGKEKLTQVQGMQRVTYRISPRRNMLRNILLKLIKIKYKEKIFKSNKEKQQ